MAKAKKRDKKQLQTSIRLNKSMGERERVEVHTITCGEYNPYDRYKRWENTMYNIPFNIIK